MEYEVLEVDLMLSPSCDNLGLPPILFVVLLCFKF
jgi:hypothetical protein